MSYPEILPHVVDSIRVINGQEYLEFKKPDAIRWLRMRAAIVAGDDAFMQAIENYPYADPEHPTANELDAAVDSIK